MRELGKERVLDRRWMAGEIGKRAELGYLNHSPTCHADLPRLQTRFVQIYSTARTHVLSNQPVNDSKSADAHASFWCKCTRQWRRVARWIGSCSLPRTRVCIDRRESRSKLRRLFVLAASSPRPARITQGTGEMRVITKQWLLSKCQLSISCYIMAFNRTSLSLVFCSMRNDLHPKKSPQSDWDLVLQRDKTDGY